MKLTFSFSLLNSFAAFAFAVQSRPADDFYYAAVVEYSPILGQDGNNTLTRNGAEYIRIIRKTAKKPVDIIVFPELGLNYMDETIYVDIPYGSDKIAPADNSSLHPVLRELSQAAKEHQVYVSFTIHEKDDTSTNETLRYNTNVVFDRKGVIVARYRKYNLFNEPFTNATKYPEPIFFDSDFGVRFGMFICFDVYFKDPALKLIYEHNVTDIIYPSWWFSELPSLLSIQMQFGWAYMTNTNLLSSGINSIQRASTGSGIYAGKKGPVVYVFSESNATRILTAKLYKIGKSGKSEGVMTGPSESVDSNLQLWQEDLKFYKTQLLTLVPKNIDENDFKKNLTLSQVLNKTICQGSLCCQFVVNMSFTYQPESFLNMSDTSYIKNDSFYHYQYRLATFNGVRSFVGGKTAGVQLCAIIPCLNNSMSSCAKKSGNTLPLMVDSAPHGKIFLYSTIFHSISIKAVSKERADFTFPDILESSTSQSEKAFGSLPDVSKLNFNTDHLVSNIQFSSDKLVFAGIYSRIVSRDMENPGLSSANSFSYTFFTVIVALFIIFALLKCY